MSDLKIEGLRALKKYIGEGYVVIGSEAYTRLNNYQRFGELRCDMYYDMKHAGVDSFTIEQTLAWVKEQKEDYNEGKKANQYIWNFRLIKS